MEGEGGLEYRAWIERRARAMHGLNHSDQNVRLLARRALMSPYAAGVCSKGSLAYRALSISMTSATLPSGLRNGNGFPVYLCEIGSMYLRSGSGRRSTTRPRSWASW